MYRKIEAAVTGENNDDARRTELKSRQREEAEKLDMKIYFFNEIENIIIKIKT